MEFKEWAKKEKKLLRIESNIRDGAFLLALVAYILM